MLKKLILCTICFLLIGTFSSCGCEHEWSDATCASLQECMHCGKTKGEVSSRHSWKLADCSRPKECTVCGLTEGEKENNHKWVSPTCVLPQTCSVCGETKGQPFGHYWLDATYVDPKTCSTCGVTEGGLADHIYKDATCKSPQTCEICGITQGEPLAHTWQDATCVSPKTCSFCNETEGEALGHVPGEWIPEELDYSSVYYSVKKYCTVCSAFVDSDIVFFNKMHEDGMFLFSPEEFSDKLGQFYSALEYNMTTSLVVLDNNSLVCGVYYRGEVIAAIFLNNDYSHMDSSEKDAHTMSSIMVYYYTDEVSYVVNSIVGIMITCDPTLEEDSANAVLLEAIDAGKKNDNHKYNGINYALTIIDNMYVFVASVLNK